MKRIDYYINEMKLYKVFLINIFLFVSGAFLCFYFLNISIVHSHNTNNVLLFSSLIYGSTFASFITYIIYTMRIANSFHCEADDIEKLAESIDNKIDLQDLYNNRFIALSKKGFHQNALIRIQHIKTMLQTKYKYLN